MIIENEPINCKSCGAMVTEDVCPYCGNLTGITIWNTEPNYPTTECKACLLNFWNIGFPTIFCGISGILGIATLIQMLQEGEMAAAGGSFVPILIGVVGAVIVIRNLLRHRTVRTRGDYITAKVIGYTNDNFVVNGSPTQVVKLLVETRDGPRVLLYRLGKTNRPYSVNSELKLLVYKDLIIIDN